MDWDSAFTYPSAGRGEGIAINTLAALALKDRPNEVPSPDFGLFRDRLNSHYYPARVEPLDDEGFTLAPRLSAVQLPHVTIGYVRFGRDASVDPGDLIGYHVNVPLEGQVVSRCGDQEAVASPAMAAVFSPHRHTYLPRWEASAAQLCIKLDRHIVEQELSALLGAPVPKPIHFRMGLAIDRGAGRRWLGLLQSLLEFVDPGATSSPALNRHLELLERSLISGLLLSQVHSYTDAINEGTGRLSRSSLDRVVGTIRASPSEPYSLADLSRIAGISARSLQYAFQEQFDVTPMQFLRQVKLDKAFEDLSNGTGPVVDVAYQLGFSNLGRFARAYRERFGELPSATLARGVTGRPRSRPTLGQEGP
jgi:AraC-like DNA-binding protein